MISSPNQNVQVAVERRKCRAHSLIWTKINDWKIVILNSLTESWRCERSLLIRPILRFELLRLECHSLSLSLSLSISGALLNLRRGVRLRRRADSAPTGQNLGEYVTIHAFRGGFDPISDAIWPESATVHVFAGRWLTRRAGWCRLLVPGWWGVYTGNYPLLQPSFLAGSTNLVPNWHSCQPRS